MVDRLLADPVADRGTRVSVLVNSLGATPLEELLIVYRKAQRIVEGAGIAVARKYVGHYATSMEMAGCSISVLDLDDEIEGLLDARTSCPFWPR
jgi:dihydroxyacetone kinase-like protein